MKVAVMVGCDEWMMDDASTEGREKNWLMPDKGGCRVQCDGPFDSYTIAIHFEPRED